MVTEIIVIILIVVIGATIMNAYEEDKLNKKRMLDISFKESLDLTDLPVITFYNNNKKINFLLDTGANNSVINSSILKNYKYKESNIVGTVTGMEGKTIDTTYVDLNLEYNNLVFQDKFQVVNMDDAFNNIKQSSGVTIHGLLGTTFFSKYRYILDFDEFKAYINK